MRARALACPPLLRASAVAVAVIVAAAAIAVVAPARAEAPQPRGELPTPGVYNPTIGVAGLGDASSIERNPAALGRLPSWSAVYLHSELDPHGNVGGRGDGFFVASPVPYLSSLAVGAALQLERPPASFPFPNQQKFSLALAWRPIGPLAFGITYSHVWATEGPLAAGLDTLDLAASLTLGRWIDAALVVHDLPSPAVARLPVQRVYEPELALRPWGQGYVELGLGARFGERRGDIDPRFRLWIRPTAGVIIKADVEWRRDLDLDGKAENDVRVALGLTLDFAHLGLSGFGLFGRDEGAARGHGFTLAARVSGDRYPAVWRGPRYLERIDLAHGVSGRALAHLLLRLRRLERDRDVIGVVAVVGDLGGGWASAEELRDAFTRLRRAGKHVYVYQAETNTRGYYVAAAAERIYQDPAGGIRLLGLGSTATFLRGFGDLIGVRADFVRIAEYKSAPEIYTETRSSPPALAERRALLDDIYAHLVDGVAATRQVPAERVRAWIDGGPYTAVEAQRAGLVDELRSGDEVEDAIAARLGHRVALRAEPSTRERIDDWGQPAIAVIFVEGDIVNGRSMTIPLLDIKLSGLVTLVSTIERAREDARVKAIVLRVDSPGGSALASDLLARELERTQKVKPIVCSLGDVAASGGYYVAAPCQRIFAMPSTVTGSIGIFAGKFDFSGLAQKLGVTLETEERGRHAGLDSIWRLYTDEERQLILDKLRYFYERFVGAVMRGRKLDFAAVDRIARGRVWSGAAAQAHGLVDEMGGLGDALAEAKRRGGLGENERVELRALPEEPSLLGQIARLLGVGADARLLDAPAARVAPARASDDRLAGLAPLLAPLVRALPASVLFEPSLPQARLPADVHVE